MYLKIVSERVYFVRIILPVCNTCCFYLRPDATKDIIVVNFGLIKGNGLEPIYWHLYQVLDRSAGFQQSKPIDVEFAFHILSCNKVQIVSVRISI